MEMKDQTADFARAVSRLCGWIYFLAWSISFYPQPVLNIRRRTTEGLTPDYPLLNVFGFSCYTTSTAVFLFSPLVRSQYAARHPASPEPTVRMNDFAFGLHACVLCVVTISQFLPSLWGWKSLSGARSKPTIVSLGLLAGCISGVAICVVLVLTNRRSGRGSGGAWAWIDVMYALTYAKLLLTVFKYIPQVVANYRRESTLGWSVDQVLLDATGGVFSLLQVLIDSSLQADWSGLTGNPVKFGLANISLLFDIIFLVQHYVLYGAVKKAAAVNDPASRTSSEREPLLR